MRKLKWINRAFKEQRSRLETEKKSAYYQGRSDKWRQQYLTLLEHNKWLQANIESMGSRIEFLKKELYKENSDG